MKLTKKLIAVVLAVLMAFAMMPMSAFADTDIVDTVDTTDATSTALKSAITAYENKMNGTIFTNMSAAYDAYVAANKAYDAYVYGDADASVATSATTALTSATSAMTEWTQYTGTAHGSYTNDGDNVSDEDYANTYNNVLYADSGVSELCANNEGFASGKSDYTTDSKFYMANATLLYDGATTPKYPVLYTLVKNSKPWNYNWNNLRLFAVYVSSSDSNLKFAGNWHGVDTQLNAQWLLLSKDEVAVNGQSDTTSTYYTQGNNNYTYANYITYTGALTTTNAYTTTITNPQLGFRVGYDKGNSAGNLTTSVTVHVINYKRIVTVMNNYKSKLASVSSYKQGGMSTMMKGFDKGTIDPNSFFTDGDNYSGCSTNYSNAETSIKASLTDDVDDGYVALRKAITDTRSTYNSTSYDKYTTESWSAFKTAFEAALNHMKALPTSGYASGTAQTLATNLTNAAASLEVNFVPADTEELEDVIDDAQVAISSSSYFTTDSYTASNLATNVPAAIKAVWGSESAYKDAASKIGDDQQSVVDAWVVTLGEGIASLVVNKDYTLSSASDYSMNSAIAEAAKYSQADYANYQDLQSAVEKANKYEAKVIVDTSDTTGLSKGIVETKINDYNTLTRAIVVAIKNLQPAFSKLTNGTVASSGENTSTVIGNYVNSTWQVTWTRPNNRIYFRTTHDAVDLDLGTNNFEWYSDRAYDQYLETLNFAPDDTSIYNGTELSSNADYTGSNDYSGKLTATASGATYKWSKFFVQTIAYNNGSSYAGKDTSGNGYTVADSHDFSDDLLVANPDRDDPNGGIITHAGTTKFTSACTLSIPATTKKTLSSSTKPTSTSYGLSTRVGSFFYWKYQPFSVYNGLGTLYADYTQNTTVIDISYLVELINECDSYTFANYTTTSWNNFTSALKAAKDEMNYGSMTASDILTQCQNRYTNLWNARAKLVEAATNDVIDTAVATGLEIKNNVQAGAVKYSSTSYDAFLTAYNNAVVAINGTYSDDNCLDLTKADYQDAIDAIAKALDDAIAALESTADFAALKAAASTAITSYAYKTADLKALATTLSGLKYLSMTDEEESNVFSNEQSAIDAETKTITDAIAALTSATPIDADTITAAKADIDAKVSDPDAYSTTAAKEYIDSFVESDVLYTAVDVYGQTVYGINYTQDSVDSIVTEALTKLVDATYDVYVDGVKYGTYNYGDEATVDFGKKVAIYYAYKSNSTENSAKYYTTDSKIKFVVKGDTQLTTKDAAGESTHKVTYVSSVTGCVIGVDYATDGGSVELPTQPSIPYYTSDGYTVNGEAFDGTDITSNITVTANYTAQTAGVPTYTINYEYMGDDVVAIPETYQYNASVELTATDSTAYWVEFASAEDYEGWANGDPLTTKEKVVFYGSTYTFRACADRYLAALSEDDLAYDIENGNIEESQVTVTKSFVASDLVYSTDKFSMIGSYVMPDDCTLVETGILFAKSNNADLKMSNVDSANIYRLKSSQHTSGNQFVISIKSANITDGQAMSYASYIIYKDAEGTSHTVISDTVNANFVK